MHKVHACEAPPTSYRTAIFLAGPTALRGAPSWRDEALAILEREGYDGAVFVPESPSGHPPPDLTEELRWEEYRLNQADVILFWVPRDMATMPGLATNVEFGMWHDSGKVVLGYPAGAVYVDYLRHYADQGRIPCAGTLHGTIRHALAATGDGALRAGGERDVPLQVWRTTCFQQWYQGQRDAGNTLSGARVLWTYRSSPDREVAAWALRVTIDTTTQDRRNEVVILRPDAPAMVL